jgi:hypothetical protein
MYDPEILKSMRKIKINEMTSRIKYFSELADIENHIEQQNNQQSQQPVATKKSVQQQPVQPPGLANKQKPMATSQVPMAQPKPTKPIVPVAPGITNQ